MVLIGMLLLSEMQIDGGNTIKKFDATTWAIFDGLSTDLTGMDTLHIGLYMTASSEFEVKLPDLTVGGVEGFYYIPAAALPADQWSTIKYLSRVSLLVAETQVLRCLLTMLSVR